MNLIKCEKLEKSMAELQFSIDAEAFKKAVADVFKKEGKKYPVQGFRKGKAPAPLPFIFAKIPLTVFLQPFTVHGQTAPVILMSVCAPTIQCPYLKPISLVKAMEPLPGKSSVLSSKSYLLIFMKPVIRRCFPMMIKKLPRCITFYKKPSAAAVTF